MRGIPRTRRPPKRPDSSRSSNLTKSATAAAPSVPRQKFSHPDVPLPASVSPSEAFSLEITQPSRPDSIPTPFSPIAIGSIYAVARWLARPAGVPRLFRTSQIPRIETAVGLKGQDGGTLF